MGSASTGGSFIERAFAWLESRRGRAPRPRFVVGRRYGLEIPGSPFDHRRATRVLSFLLDQKLLRRRLLRYVRPVTLHVLRRVHTDGYLDSLQERGALTGVLGFDPGEERQEAYLLSHREQVAGTIAAAAIAQRRGGLAVNLGGGFHHAMADRAQGFCVFNDVAVAIADCRARGAAGSVLVIDLDLHDGDGTRRLFAADPTVHTFSIHNRHLGPVDALASTSIALGDGVDDARYLKAIREHLTPLLETDAPALAFFVAGTDPAVDDRLGNWRISAEGLLERDQLVLGMLREAGPVPTAMLLGGGYGQQAWRYTARSLSALLHHGVPIEPPQTTELTLDRYRRAARLLRRGQLGAQRRGDSWELTEADLDAVAGARGRARFLDYYSRHGLEFALERFGFFDKLRERGFRALRLELELEHPGEHTLRILSEEDDGERLVELRARRDRRTIPDMTLLALEWLLLQNPRATFAPERPRLPGQRYPGLGLLGDVMALLVLVCERLELDGIVFVPAHYHIAAQAASYFRFLDPDAQARFVRLRRVLGGLRLPEAIAALENGRVRDRLTGEPVAWQPATMVLAVSDRLKERLERAGQPPPSADGGAGPDLELRG